MKDNTYLSWAVIGGALCAWAAVGFFAWTIENAAKARAEGETIIQQEEIERVSASRLRVVARETEEGRAELDSLANLDVISIIEAIEAVGNAARVSIEIGQALADSAQTAERATRSVNVVVEAQGSFANLVHAASLLYSLPIPSEVTEIQIERLPSDVGGKSAGWRFVAYVRVLTTVEIST